MSHNELVFRWDLLHLANRSHISARGSTAYEEKKAAKKRANATEATDEIDYDIIENTSANTTAIAQLIDYIQTQARKYRTGLVYTDMKISDSSFKRPKIWSTTRMCLYEFEMTLRWLENKIYFEVLYNGILYICY